MSTEIERRFLVSDPELVPAGIMSYDITQGYMYSGANGTVRFRVREDEGFVTIKGKPAPGHFGRSEFEYPVPAEDARAMIEQLCSTRVIRKTRRVVPVGDRMWEVDFFHGRHEGLVIAELELESEDQEFEMPDFLGEEVTGKKGYSNAALSLQ